MSKKLELISAAYIDGYNDTTMYEAKINYNGIETLIGIEVHHCDMETPNKVWEVLSSVNITNREKEEILKEILKDIPRFVSDAPPKIYNKEINVIYEKRNMDGWKKSNSDFLTDYLKIGDIVDKDIVDYIINSLTPRTMTGILVQDGEIYSSDKNGRNTYITFARENPNEEWYYKGACFVGETENKERKFELFDMSYIEKEHEQEEVL